MRRDLCCKSKQQQHKTTSPPCSKTEVSDCCSSKKVTSCKLEQTDGCAVSISTGCCTPKRFTDDLERGSGEHVVFNVSGMECTGCEGIARKAFEKIPGISQLQVAFVTGTASCNVDTSITSIDELIRIMHSTTKYKLTRLEDKDQSLDILTQQDTDELALPGINSIRRLNKTIIRIGYDPSIIGARALMQHFTGATLAPIAQNEALSAGAKHVRKLLIYTTASAVLTIPVLVLAWGTTAVPEHEKQIISFVLATFVQAMSIPVFYTPAVSALVTSRTIEMDMLVVLSITAAYGYSLMAFAFDMAGSPLQTGSFFETSTLLITLVLLGRLIAGYARNKAVKSVSLQSLQPTLATIMTEAGHTETIDARLLELNDHLVVQAHSQVVTDGIVETGTSELDESMITGESYPVLKVPGDHITAGTMNGSGVLHVKLTRLPGQNTINDIAKLVQQAHSEKPRVQELADKVASYFIPAIVGLALAVVIIWIAVNITLKHQPAGSAIGSAITYGIAVLAISCPCALGLAVPMVLVIASGRAARAGIVIKTADVVERGFKVTDVVFDKTGTLTEDKLTIVQEHYEEAVCKHAAARAIIAAMIQGNVHPISKAMSEHLSDEKTTGVQLGEVVARPGQGISCSYEGAQFCAGSSDWTQMSDHPAVKTLVAEGLTMLCITKDSHLMAAFGIRTALRQEAQAVVNTLQQHRNLCVHILSGDTQQAVDNIATQLGIPSTHAHGRRSPAQKQEYVRKLMAEDKIVLFCGDGTNDAIAVTQANVGVQIAPSASDVTKATADVVLMSNDLAGVIQLLDISKAAYTRICFNFLWAALYNVFAILLASGAFVDFRIEPAYAGLGEIVSVLPVVFVALTIQKPKRLVTA